MFEQIVVVDCCSFFFFWAVAISSNQSLALVSALVEWVFPRGTCVRDDHRERLIGTVNWTRLFHGSTADTATTIGQYQLVSIGHASKAHFHPPLAEKCTPNRDDRIVENHKLLLAGCCRVTDFTQKIIKTAHFFFPIAQSFRLVCLENYLTWQFLIFSLLSFTTVDYMNLAASIIGAAQCKVFRFLAGALARARCRVVINH